MKVLGVDTTSGAGSIAILEGEHVCAQTAFRSPAGHAQQLLPEMDRLLASSGWSLADIDAFAVAAGPGSFTGLRIGIASIEGLAYATGRPVVGVSTLEATAYHHRSQARLVAPFLDARREEIFGALYRLHRLYRMSRMISDGGEPEAGKGPLEALVEPVCEPPKKFLDRLAQHTRQEKILLAGDGVTLYRGMIRDVLGDRVELAEPVSEIAEEVARLGQRRLAAGQAAPLGALKAQYLRIPDAERARR